MGDFIIQYRAILLSANMFTSCDNESTTWVPCVMMRVI